MAAKKASGPACKCGQVVFDLAGKKPGAILRCPWCQQRYRLEEDGTVTPVARKATESTVRMIPVRSKPRSHGSSASPPKRRDDAGDEEGGVEVFRFDSDDGPEEGQSAPSSRRRGVRKREGAGESDESAGPETPVRSSSRSPGPSIGRRERSDEVLDEGDDVEVIRFNSEEEAEEERTSPSSRLRGVRQRDMAAEPTERLDRISRRRTRKLEPVEEAGEGEVPDDALPPLKPLDLEKWVVRMFLGLIPLGTLFFMGYVIYGVYKGERDFVTYRILGLTIRGDNPWVWFAGIVLGSLVFLGLWIGYVYVFVHKKKLAELEEERRKEEGGSSSRRGARGSRRANVE